MPPQRRKRSQSPTSRLSGRQQLQRIVGPEIEQAAAGESAHSAHSMGEHAEEAGAQDMADAPQEAAADVPQSHAATDNWWEDVSETQRPRDLPVFVPISTVTGNVMYNNSLPVAALGFAARNRGLTAVGEKAILVHHLQENDLAPPAEDISDTQPPQQLPLYVPTRQETGNVMYSSFPDLALRNVARNRGLGQDG